MQKELILTENLIFFNYSVQNGNSNKYFCEWNSVFLNFTLYNKNGLSALVYFFEYWLLTFLTFFYSTLFIFLSYFFPGFILLLWLIQPYRNESKIPVHRNPSGMLAYVDENSSVRNGVEKVSPFVRWIFRAQLNI